MHRARTGKCSRDKAIGFVATPSPKVLQAHVCTITLKLFKDNRLSYDFLSLCDDYCNCMMTITIVKWLGFPYDIRLMCPGQLTMLCGWMFIYISWRALSNC